MNPIRRPKPEENEEDLLRMQEEFQRGQQQQRSAQVKRVVRKPDGGSAVPPQKSQSYGHSLGPQRAFAQGGRFTIDLDQIEEEHTPTQVVFSVQERNTEILESANSDAFKRYTFDKLHYSKDDGFPAVLDLCAYYQKSKESRRSASLGKSFFAAEFDRIHGKLEESLPGPSISQDEQMTSSDDIGQDNEHKLKTMNADEIARARAEIEEKLDPKLIEFLMNRNKKNKKTLLPENRPEVAPKKPKVSKFKQERQTTDNPLPPPVSEAKEKPVVSDMIKKLEVLEEFADRKTEEKYNRLAADAVQLDFATKCARTMLPRQTQNAIKLFEILKFRQENAPDDPLVEMARTKIDDIKLLYLEEVKTGDQDKTIHQFARGLNPVVDGCWMLRPIRTVVDAVQAREGEIFEDDIDMIRLSLLWSLLLLTEKPSIFHTMVDIADFYVRLAEVFIVGTEAFTDDVISQCVNRLLDGFVIPKAKEGRLVLRLANPVAGLDAFMPFYEDLLKRFEEYSVGDPTFTKTLLIGAYLNNAISDAMECKLAVWGSRRHVAREMTASKQQLSDLISIIKPCVTSLADIWEEEYYVQYATLLSDYAAALANGRVKRERNGALFELAADELGRFVERHSDEKNENVPTEKLKQFDALVAVVRSTVKDVLVI